MAISNRTYPKFNELSSEQQKFLHELSAKGTDTVNGWHDFFLGLAQFDKKGDKLRSAGCFFKTFFGLMFLFGVSFAILSLIQGEDGSSFIIPILAIIISILSLVVANRYYKDFENRDIPNPLRRFFVPFLELLKVQSAGSSPMELDIDLVPMHELFGTKEVGNDNDAFDYIRLSCNLPHSGTLKMKVGAHGKTHTDKDKLTHTIVFSITCDAASHQLTGKTGDFEIKEVDGKIILQHEYEEHSRSIIVDDPGLDFHLFSPAFNEMIEAVEKKPS